MVTVLLQFGVALLLAIFSVCALYAARFGEPGSAQRQSWVVTGVAHVPYAAISLVQMTWAIGAFLAGPGEPLYDRYLDFAPVGNHARTLLLFALYAGLGWVALRPRGRLPSVRATAALVLAAALLGGGLGLVEGRFDVARHLSATAVLDIAGFAFLGGVLLLGIQRDSIDRLLWICLALHGFRSVFGVLHLSAMAWFGIPGSWAPPAWQIHLFRVVLLSAQVGFAYHRIRLGRRGTRVPGLVPTPPRHLKFS